MRAEIVATGTELLLGQIVDTNTPFLADQLALLGIDLYYAGTVGDNYDRMIGMLEQAWERSDLIITTGGLGPTRGDITRDVVAGLVGEQPHVDSSLKHHIESFFSRRLAVMPPNNLKQATLIPSAVAILNPHGTAPGWWVEKAGRTIICLPGPPRELQPMWQSFVFPKLEQKSGAIIVSKMIKTQGLSESAIDEMVCQYTSCANPTLAMYAKLDGIQLRITAKASQREQAQQMISQREAEIRAVLGDHVWGAGDDTLEGVVGRLLREKALTLAVNESFTGGYLTQTIAISPECRGYFRGGTVTCGVNGSESAGTRELAALARRQFRSDIGIGIEGQSETVGGIQTGKAFVAIDMDQAKDWPLNSVSGIYPQIRTRATYFALSELRKALLRV